MEGIFKNVTRLSRMLRTDLISINFVSDADRNFAEPLNDPLFIKFGKPSA
jgi:hypothetical protein